jgi:Ser/Thr protein kinase RdoA (MazF antagonist)
MNVERGFAALGRRGQIGRLRALGHAALTGFGMSAVRMTPLRHEYNTTFRVDSPSGRYVLRISRPDGLTHQSIASEAEWLAAIRADTNLSVPEPVAAQDGRFVVLASHASVPEPRACVLFRWMDGRFVNDRLRPAHLRRVGALIAGLHDHAHGWVRPAAFVRPRVETLTSKGKLESIEGFPATQLANVPTQRDVDRALRLVTDLLPASAGLLGDAIELARASVRALAARPGSVGLIHGDLHPENYLFRGGEVLAIDFDDCGWGFLLYDLAEALWELENRPDYPQLHDALLDGYAIRRPLPVDVDVHLRAFAMLRRVQILLWILESREHPSFRDDWHTWAEKEARGIRAAQGRGRAGPKTARPAEQLDGH